MKKLLLLLLLFSGVVFAASSGLGQVADNLMGPVDFLSNFVYSACFIVGGGFIFASIIKYFEHKRSPLMVPISTPIFLFIAGLILVLLPFTYLLVQGAPSYTVFH